MQSSYSPIPFVALLQEKLELEELETLYQISHPEASDDHTISEIKSALSHWLKEHFNESTYLDQVTDSFFDWTKFFNSCRLLALRVNRILLALGNNILPSWFAYFGLLFLAELALDVGVIVKSAFYGPQKPKHPGRHTTLDPADEKNERERIWNHLKNAYQRINKAAQKDKRRYRMINAFLWGIINLICFFVASSISISLNWIGFALDVVHELFTLRCIDEKFKGLDNKLDMILNILKARNDQPSINRIAEIKNALKQKYDAAYSQQKKTTKNISLVFIGMSLIYSQLFPGAYFVGGALTLFAGTIGFYNRSMKYWSTPATNASSNDNKLTRSNNPLTQSTANLVDLTIKSPSPQPISSTKSWRSLSPYSNGRKTAPLEHISHEKLGTDIRPSKSSQSLIRTTLSTNEAGINSSGRNNLRSSSAFIMRPSAQNASDPSSPTTNLSKTSSNESPTADPRNSDANTPALPRARSSATKYRPVSRSMRR